MEVNYFFDSYAVVEIVKGNPSYQPYADGNIALTMFNLAEIYWSVLNDFREGKADEVFDTFRRGLVEIDDITIKKAVKFRRSYKKQDLSYTDCIGYIYAKRHGLKFLTGDKEFEHLNNVEFVK